MRAEIQPELLEEIEKAYYVWFTTVRDDGMPQPTPVWFIYENGAFLVYTTEQAHKLQNLIDNPHVALSYTDTADADSFWVIMGDAVVDRSTPPANLHPKYYAKYAAGIPEIGMTPESMAQTFSAPIRITPTRVRTGG